MIDQFEGKYRFLSNFAYSPFIHEGILYPTNEHFFQAQKTLDIQERSQIAMEETPGRAKRAGRRVTLRPDWEQVKDEVMMIGLREKFKHPALRKALLETGDEELVEGNTWGDRYWGKCQGTGLNKLGKSLMTLRQELRAEGNF